MTSTRACSTDGCLGEVHAFGVCLPHYCKLRRRGLLPSKPTPAERMDSLLVQTPSGCIEWTGLLVSGYGVLRVRGKSTGAHRLAWELANGPIPDGLCVLHRCDNPPCCNPEHLFLGTQKDNNRDMAAKGRHYMQARTHCPQGHPYDDANTYPIPSGGRGCRACRGKRKAAA